MAVAYASSNSSGWVNGGSSSDCVVTKPTGLAVGDMLVLQYQREAPASDSDFSSQGFTVITTQNQNTASAQMSNYVGYKIADSSDVAASTFTFNSGGTSNAHQAALYRITGASSTGIVSTSGTSTNTSSVSVSELTQPTADNLLLMLVAGTDAASTVSSYAIATTNPTWTELLDSSTTIGDDHFMASAWATRSPATATGNVTCTVSDATSDTFLTLLSIRPIITSSTLETVTLTEVLSTIRMRVVTILETLTLTESLSSLVSKWTNSTKSTLSSWLNLDKS